MTKLGEKRGYLDRKINLVDIKKIHIFADKTKN